ncbi:hypothetical protein VKT23_020609 [Stygiomarasmius scandens]|uniref:Uncharacterized protein n=1 Tax=Marasmiellus scandens TaxID=2682957 RepID=A0ABR1IM93_9AGAR
MSFIPSRTSLARRRETWVKGKQRAEDPEKEDEDMDTDEEPQKEKQKKKKRKEKQEEEEKRRGKGKEKETQEKEKTKKTKKTKKVTADKGESPPKRARTDDIMHPQRDFDVQMMDNMQFKEPREEIRRKVHVDQKVNSQKEKLRMAQQMELHKEKMKRDRRKSKVERERLTKEKDRREGKTMPDWEAGPSTSQPQPGYVSSGPSTSHMPQMNPIQTPMQNPTPKPMQHPTSTLIPPIPMQNLTPTPVQNPTPTQTMAPYNSSTLHRGLTNTPVQQTKLWSFLINFSNKPTLHFQEKRQNDVEMGTNEDGDLTGSGQTTPRQTPAGAASFASDNYETAMEQPPLTAPTMQNPSLIQLGIPVVYGMPGGYGTLSRYGAHASSSDSGSAGGFNASAQVNPGYKVGTGHRENTVPAPPKSHNEEWVRTTSVNGS